MAEWPDSVPVLFVDGPLAGEVHRAPARAGVPAMMLRVRMRDATVEVRPAADQGPGAGWDSYLGLGLARPRRSSEGASRDADADARDAEPWAFVHSD